MTSAIPTHPASQHWVIRYRLYHIPFWFVYHYCWWTITIANPIKAASTIFYTPFGIKFFFYVFFQAVAVYFNLYYLMPRLLQRRKITVYVLCLMATTLGASLLIVPGYYVGAMVAGKTVQQLYNVGENCFFAFFGNAFPSTVAAMTLAMSIKLTKNWIQTERRHQQLEKEKLETELKFLKYQINPHFLFNSINSIFFLIHKNPDMASASLAKFSDLLRYQLYECNDLQIALAKEITYLQNFIELERLRQNKNVGINLQLQTEHTGHLGIAPFMLMTFVENAFKHVSKYNDRSNWINIKLELTGTALDFSVSNSVASIGQYTGGKDLINYGGIGLQNVRRRLELIYPGQYDFSIQEVESIFAIHLHLTLSELRVPDQQMLQTA